MIWPTVSSRSYFCWLYRSSPSLTAKNIINLISVGLSGDAHGPSPLWCLWKQMFAMMSTFSFILSLYSLFWPREVPLTVVVKLVWWCWTVPFLLVCKVFDFSIEYEWEPWWAEYFCFMFFPFITLNMSCHSLLSCSFCWEASW